MSSEFQIKLKQLREERDLSQYDFARMFGVSQGAVGNWESGKREPKHETTVRIADFFGVTTDYLLGRDSVDTYEKREPGTQTDAELSELNSIISRLSDGNRAKLRELAQLYLDSEQRKEENG